MTRRDTVKKGNSRSTFLWGSWLCHGIRLKAGRRRSRWDSITVHVGYAGRRHGLLHCASSNLGKFQGNWLGLEVYVAARELNGHRCNTRERDGCMRSYYVVSDAGCQSCDCLRAMTSLLKPSKLRQTRSESEAKAKKPVSTDNSVRCVHPMWP